MQTAEFTKLQTEKDTSHTEKANAQTQKLEFLTFSDKLINPDDDYDCLESMNL